MAQPKNRLEEFEKQFNNNLLSPKLVLIGEKCDEEERLSANLVGIEVKELRRWNKSSISIEKSLENLNSYKNFIEIEMHSLRDRINQNVKLYEKFEECCKAIDTNLEPYGNVYQVKDSYNGTYNPFMDFGVKITDDDKIKYICGFYDFYYDLKSDNTDNDLAYSNEYFYGDIYFGDFNFIKIKEKKDEKFKEVLKYAENHIKREIKECSLYKNDPYIKVEGKSIITNISRNYFKNIEKMGGIFKKHIKLALSLREKFDTGEK